jgi:general stress protein 26
MSAYLPISFIEEKIKDLENALFFSMSDAVLKIPTCVVKILETDDLGQLWFQISKPAQSIHAFDRIFPVELDFFRKGKDYYLKVFGKAFLVNDPEEINSAECLTESIKQKVRNNDTLLVRVQISQAEYSEKGLEVKSAKNILHQFKTRFYNWFQLSQQEGQMHTQRIPVQSRYPSITSFTN